MGRRILFANSGALPIPPSDGGAIQQVLYALACELARRGWDVAISTVSTERSRVEEQEGINKQVRWIHLERPPSSGGVRGIARSWWTFRRSIDQVRRFEPAVVVLFDPYLAPLFRTHLREAQIVWHVHNVRVRSAPLVKRWARAINKVVFVSHFVKGKVEPLLGPASNMTLSVMHNPIEARWLETQSGVPTASNFVVFVGRLIPQKGLHVLAEAMALLPEFLRSQVRVRVVGGTHFGGSGSGSAYVEQVRQRFERAGAAVEWTGYIPREQVVGMYDQATVVVVPSTWGESAGMVALEAQARARPVIASGVGGLPELIAPEWKGNMVPPNDAAALAARLRQVLLLSENSRLIAGLSARNWVSEQFNIGKVGDQWEAILAAET